MEEFDFDLTNDIGTPVLQLKNKSKKQKNNFNYEIENINYNNSDNFDNYNNSDNFDNYNNSETIIPGFNYDNNRDDLINKMACTINNNSIKDVENVISNQKTSQTKKQNINNFIKKLENNLDNFNKPTPKNQTIEPMLNTNNKQKNQNLIKKICNFEYIEILISILLFMLLNNKLIIEIIYSIPLLQKINSPYPNLLIRAMIFGLILFLTKNFNI
jgi:hypothetical protein